MVEAFQARRDLVVEGLRKVEGIRCQMPKGAFYVFPNVAGVCERLGILEAYRRLPAAVRALTTPSTLLQMFLLFEYQVATMDRKSFGRIGTEKLHSCGFPSPRISTRCDLPCPGFAERQRTRPASIASSARGKTCSRQGGQECQRNSDHDAPFFWTSGVRALGGPGPALSEKELAAFERFDLLYRSLCAMLFNYVPMSGHPGGSISSGRIAACLAFGGMDYDVTRPGSRMTRTSSPTRRDTRPWGCTPCGRFATRSCA